MWSVFSQWDSVSELPRESTIYQGHVSSSTPDLTTNWVKPHNGLQRNPSEHCLDMTAIAAFPLSYTSSRPFQRDMKSALAQHKKNISHYVLLERRKFFYPNEFKILIALSHSYQREWGNYATGSKLGGWTKVERTDCPRRNKAAIWMVALLDRKMSAQWSFR